MKMKNLVMGLAAAVCIALLFLPLSPIVVKIFFLVEFAFSCVILGFAFYAAVKKSIQNVMSYLILYFSLFSLAMFVAPSRLIFAWQPGTKIELVSYMAEDIINPQIVGYIIAVVSLIFLLSGTQNVKNKFEGALDGSIKFFAENGKAIAFIFAALVLGTPLIGMKQMHMTFVEGFKMYLPYCCAQLFIYSILYIIVNVALTTLLWVDRGKK